MKRTPSITVSRLSFNTKKALLDYTRTILTRYEAGDCLNSEDFDFIRALLDRHPESASKVGCGLAAVQVYIPSLWANSRTRHKGFLAVREDGSTVDFGFHQCISPRNPKSQFNEGCRGAVATQILDFRNKVFRANGGRVLCPCEDRLIEVKDCHIDHHPVLFIEIVDSFVAQHNIDVASVAYEEVEFASKPKFKDHNLERDWKDFHKKHAILRVISSGANLRKGSKGEVKT